MAPTATSLRSSDIGVQRRSEADRVVRALEQLCDDQEPGAKIATHTELMRQMNASERTILRALDELQRQGRVVRRHGSGTFVAHRVPARPVSTPVVIDEMNAIVAIAHPDQSFFDRCIELLYSHARSADLDLVCRLMSNKNDLSTVLKGIGKAAGYVVFSYNCEPIARELAEAGHRVVIVGAPPVDVIPDIPCVYGNHEQGGYMAAKHLIQFGHDRLLFMSDSPEPKRLARWRGISRAVAEARRSDQPVEVEILAYNQIAQWKANPELVRAIMQAPGAPTGIIAWNDNEALHILTALNGAGIKVPQDVSLIGYDALPQGLMVHPTLTTVDSMIHQQLDAAVQLLTQPVPQRGPYTAVALPTLIQRGSTAQR